MVDHGFDLTKLVYSTGEDLGIAYRHHGLLRSARYHCEAGPRDILIGHSALSFRSQLKFQIIWLLLHLLEFSFRILGLRTKEVLVRPPR